MCYRNGMHQPSETPDTLPRPVDPGPADELAADKVSADELSPAQIEAGLRRKITAEQAEVADISRQEKALAERKRALKASIAERERWLKAAKPRTRKSAAKTPAK